MASQQNPGSANGIENTEPATSRTRKRSRGRPTTNGPLRDDRVEVYLTSEEKTRFENWAAQLAARQRKRLSNSQAGLWAFEYAITLTENGGPVMIEGLIRSTKKEMEVVPPPVENLTVQPPFPLPQQSYALIVADTAVKLIRSEIPTNSYIFLAKGMLPGEGAIVHVEFFDKNGKSKLSALKRFYPKFDGTADFTPLDQVDDTINVSEDSYSIHGVFVRAWTRDEMAALRAAEQTEEENE